MLKAATMLLKSLLIFLAIFSQLAFSSQLPKISSQELRQEIKTLSSEIPAFKRLHEIAKANKVKVYLIGGSVSALSHFAKWRIQQRKAGQPKPFIETRLEPKLHNILRLTQDIDFAVEVPEGTSPEESRRITEIIEAKMNSEFPRFKANWQSLGLNFSVMTENGKEKNAVLSDDYFYRQHTDSYSRVLLDLNRREVLDPISLYTFDQTTYPAENFFEQIADDRITFIESGVINDGSTRPFSFNPPFMNATRALIKASQYGVSFSPDDFEKISAIIRDFDPAKYDDIDFLRRLKNQIEKIYLHSYDIEHSQRLLIDSGLLDVIKKLAEKYQAFEQTLVLLSRKPLPRAHPIKTSHPGRTAGELGISIVVHETSDALLLESITWRPDGKLNALISQSGIIGQNAEFGDGFYTKNAEEGLMKTGSSIEILIDPSAVEGVDFILTNDDRNLILLRSERVRFNHKTLVTNDLIQLWKAVGEGKIGTEIKGMLEPRVVELFPQFHRLKPKAKSEVLAATQKLLDRHLADKKNPILSWQLKIWFRGDNLLGLQNPQLLEQIIDAKDKDDWRYLLKLTDDTIVSNKYFIQDPTLLEKLLVKTPLGEMDLKTLSHGLLRKLSNPSQTKVINTILKNKPDAKKEELRKRIRTWLKQEPKSDESFERPGTSDMTKKPEKCEQILHKSRRGSAGLDPPVDGF